MKLHEEGEFTALNWVKQALDAELALAREALEAFVGNPSDLAPMRDCVVRLHQVQGSLRMVELYGAAMVVENMERLAESLLAGTVRQREESYSVLMRGMVQLPDYLERLQSGHRDIPIVLLPLLNDLRACRGENLLTESALFAPDLAVPLPASADGRAQPLIPTELRAQALRLRLAFQAALLKWIRDEGSAEHLHRLMDVLDRLRAISSGADARRLWWIAAAVIEAVENGGLEASVAVKLLFGRVDREIHRFAKEGEAGFAAQPPRELTKNLLYYVAHSGDAGAFPDGARSAEVRRAYQLDTLLPTEGEMQHAQGSMTGHNRNLLGTVSAAIKDDLLRVKDALDLFLRSGRSDPSGLEGQVELLDRVGDTLGMLGLGVPRRVVGEQRDIILGMARSQREVDEGTLLDVAGALLYVEASLDDHIERLGADGVGEADQGALELPQAEVRRILDALMREAAVNIDQAKHDIVAFIESPWDHQRVGQIPRLLEEIAGALRMLGLPDPAELMAAIVRFVEVELIGHRRVPTAEQMDKLADALAAIEYYLEASREQRRNRDRILDVARESLDALGYWPLPDAPPETFVMPAAMDAAAPLHDGGASASGHDPVDAFVASDDAGAGLADDVAPGAYGVPGIDVLPGRDINDLVIGEAATPPPAGQELDGLRLADTSAGDAGDGWIEIEEEIEEEVPIEDASPSGFDTAASEEIDDDIREVFIEEVEEEIGGMRQQLPRWKNDLEDLEQLKPLRRAFHTLKGSGRLVGARALGEFSWKVENLLNRLLDRSIAVTPAAVALVERAIDAVPALLAALRGEPSGHVDTAGFAEVADRLAAGEEAWLPEQPALTRIVRRTVRRRIPAPGAGLPVMDVDAGPASLADDAGGRGGEIVAGPLPNIDPVLFDILQSEVAGHLATIEEYLADCTAQPAPVSEPLLRAAHTLNGAIAMVDIPAIGHVLAPLESYVKRLRSAGIVPDAGGLAAMREAVELTRSVMRKLDARDTELPDSRALAATLAALAAGLPESDPRVLWESIGGDAAAGAEDVEPPAPGWAADTEFDQTSGMAGGDGEVRPFPAAGAGQSSEPEDSWLGTAPVSADDASLWDAPPGVGFAADVGAADEPALETDAEAHGGQDVSGTDVADPELPHEDSGSSTEQTTEAVIPDDLMAALEAFDPAAAPSGEAGGEAAPAAGDEAPGVPFTLPDMDEGAFGAPEPAEPDTVTGFPEQAGEEADASAGESPATSADVSGWSETASSAEWFAAPHEEPGEDADVPLEGAVEESVAQELGSQEPAEDMPAVEALPAEDEALAEEEPLALAEGDASADDARLGSPPADTLPGSDTAEASAEHLDTGAAEPAMLGGAMPPPLAEDPQPEGTLGLADIDDDLLDIFVQEGADILDHADTVVARLREAPGEHAPIVELQRDLHTLKGGARMAGLAPIGDLSHAMESLVDALSEGSIHIDRKVVESLEHGFDRLHVLVQRVAQRRAIAMPANAIARFERIVAGEPIGSAPAAASPAEDATGAAAAATAAPAVPLPRRLTAMDREETPHAPQELIRVRSELLDSLVNYAGEVSIYRSRLEQQISTFRFNLVELDQTVTRLREQLRKLEIETEAQIIARYQREQQDTLEGAFDPLELDRFSQLQQLSRALGESVSDLVSIQGLLDDQTRQSETLLLQQSRVSSDLQEGLMRTRMVPFDSLVPNLRRTLRQAAEELGKRAQLKVEGAHGEMDRNLLERMKAPFEHMLRNALAHGVESPAQRQAAGKPEEGTVGIVVSREATEVVLRIADDGRGMDRDAIRQQAIERGLLKPDVELSDRDLYGFVLETGFSTARELTQLSGRGVGMDVVHNEIKQLGGSLAIDSTPGKGTEFTIRLPFTLAVTQAILVRLGESTYAIPMSSVQGVARIAGDDLERRLAAGETRQVYGGEEYQIHDLAQLLGVPRVRAAIGDDAQVPLLMIRSGDQRAAVRIDSVVGSREIVVKSVGPQVSSVPGIFGATIMGDGAVVIILDLAPLVRRLIALRAHAAEAGMELEPPPSAPLHAPQPRRKPLVMVVDDSITMRKVTTRVLERADFEVSTAKDGLDALEKLQDLTPDLLLLDIEMPRMDGYELAIYMRNDARLKQVPIIMITSRTGEKHRQRALEIGVERYLGKPYQEDDLLRHVHETLEVERG
ncbi:MAG: Hpt domain-containing protein [Xanthomonadales bacterium]|nr:Hpt domain-containing protein [Xanthomonadales bacterium]